MRPPSMTTSAPSITFSPSQSLPKRTAEILESAAERRAVVSNRNAAKCIMGFYILSFARTAAVEQRDAAEEHADGAQEISHAHPADVAEPCGGAVLPWI